MSHQRAAFGHRDHNGWHTTTDDYHVHVSRMERMPSTIDAPHFPNFGSLFNNNKITHDEPETTQRVQVTEKVHIEQSKKDGNNHQVYEENVDVEAEDFIRRKHKNFELCKWMSMKPY
ncbi:hypothetical protein BVC80_1065g153 [Macleaya cordata]|uniref:Uncharacterized protein n=1 Tax=Macleaya cordata TaxID=56857 RepID=A0A200RD03_MACCD|nr:hypothetical protein BVC80_1065g153 [Macleaya cordata]